MSMLCGISPTTVQNFELGKTEPTIWYMLKLADVAGIPLGDLLGAATYEYYKD
jgi:transcriptional regulator with XRE-family HTH domain